MVGTIYSDFETRIRQDLSDSGSPSLLSSADIDRHIDHAVRDLALVAPLDLLLTATLTPNSRNVDLTSTLSGVTLLRLDAVEWPTGQYPQEFVQFNLFGDVDPVLTLLVEQAPTSADTINLYAKVAPVVTSSSGTSTLPPRYDDIVALGAAGYAAQELATRLMNTINVGGPIVWEHYLTLSTQLLSDFGQELDLLAQKNQFFVKRLYAPSTRPRASVRPRSTRPIWGGHEQRNRLPPRTLPRLRPDLRAHLRPQTLAAARPRRPQPRPLAAPQRRPARMRPPQPPAAQHLHATEDRLTIFDHHKALWMWEFSQQAEKSLPEACATAKNLAGADLLLVKAMDGVDWMSLYDPGGYASLAQFQADAAAAAAGGVTVVPWVVPHGANPAGEAAAHAQLGPVLVCDVEPYPGFWTGSAANLPIYLQALRQGGVRELHISIDPRPAALAALGGAGAGGWAPLVDGIHPQCYWTDFQQPALSVLPAIQNLSTAAHVYPVLPGDGAAADLADVWNAAVGAGCQGVSVWRLGSMTAPQLAGFANLAVPAPPPPGPTVDERIAALDAQLADMSGELARLNQVLTKRFLLIRDALDPDNPPA